MITYKLYLDDIRVPSVTAIKAQKHGLDPQIYSQDDWVIVRNYQQFVETITSRYTLGQWPGIISFDHDLGQEHTDYFFQNGGWNSPPNPLLAEFTEKTGYDCAKWLINYIMDNETLSLPKCYVHSANPVGRENIKMLLENFEKHN
jgi:hypothetical protein